jgi:hypothetical protein
MWLFTAQFAIQINSRCDKVQERALNAVPSLCETIDYAEVQGVLFPRVAVRLPLRLVFIDVDEGYLAVGVYQNPNIGRQSGNPNHLSGHGKNP